MAGHKGRFAGIEVDGRNVQNILESFRLFPGLAIEAMTRHGIGRKGPNGTIDVKADAWYPLDSWLRVFDDILAQVGPAKLLQMGSLVPEYAVLPPEIDDVGSGLKLCDIAYHLNHRKNGVVMFDVETGRMLEGIGHYHCRLVEERHAIMECDAVYPCDFDRGIIIGLGNRFGGKPRTTHVGEACRKRGATRCTYDVLW